MLNRRRMMDSFDEIPLEDHHFFAARLAYLETHQPKTLLDHLENDSLTCHLREQTNRAMNALGELALRKQIPLDQAEELVMSQIVADAQAPVEPMNDPQARRKLQSLLQKYREAMPNLPRTYQSQLETTE